MGKGDHVGSPVRVRGVVRIGGVANRWLAGWANNYLSLREVLWLDLW